MALGAQLILDIAKLGALAPSAMDSMEAAVYREGNSIMTESKMECPVDVGYLRNTGYVNSPQRSGDTVTVELGYKANYAIYQHERLDYHHKVGKAKFLEDPMNRRIPLFNAGVADAVRSVIG